MSDQSPPVCCQPGCEASAIVRFRTRPKRVDAPLCEHVARSLTHWPGVVFATDLYACPARLHQQAVRAVGFVLAVEPLSSVVATRTVGEEGAS